MKSWSLVILFAFASVICMAGCQQETKADPAFKKDNAPPPKKKDNTNRQQSVDFGV